MKYERQCHELHCFRVISHIVCKVCSTFTTHHESVHWSLVTSLWSNVGQLGLFWKSCHRRVCCDSCSFVCRSCAHVFELAKMCKAPFWEHVGLHSQPREWEHPRRRRPQVACQAGKTANARAAAHAKLAPQCNLQTCSTRRLITRVSDRALAWPTNSGQPGFFGRSAVYLSGPDKRK